MIGVFGGSGFYSLLDRAETVEMDTPFGAPSSPITIGRIQNREVAFLARHGVQHEYPPHKIPYKANIYAFRELGVTRIIAPTAVGSLRKDIAPGHFLVPDQFVTFTRRDDTFYEERPVTHISTADPYCPELRMLALAALRAAKVALHESGTVVVVEGPRFASRAESEYYRRNGWDIINMTQYPELALAREMEMCYANISLVTDYDTGVKGESGVRAVTLDEVIRVFKENNEKLRNILFAMVAHIPDVRTCPCAHALEGSRFS